MCSSFKLKCPNHSQWSLRARAFCPSDPSKYSCIQNEHIKGYTEGCSVAEFERGGLFNSQVFFVVEHLSSMQNIEIQASFEMNV